MAKRFELRGAGGVRLACYDFGGPGEPVLALHGHFSRARTFAGLAERLAGRWRVIAIDQRGHGHSDAPGDYGRSAYVEDAAAVVRALDLGPVVVLGHSLGGVNAYQLAARHPELVRAIVVEDIGAVVDGDLEEFLAGWPERFPSLLAMRRFLERRLGGADYFLESAAEFEDGWGFLFRYADMIRSQRELNGDWWADWTGSRCPALLLRGGRSPWLSAEHARELVERRPDTRLVEFADCGHSVHDEDPEGYAAAVAAFLEVV